MDSRERTLSGAGKLQLRKTFAVCPPVSGVIRLTALYPIALQVIADPGACIESHSAIWAAAEIPTWLTPTSQIAILACLVSLVIAWSFQRKAKRAGKNVEKLRLELETLAIDTRKRMQDRTDELERANEMLNREAIERNEVQLALADREARLKDAQQIAQLGSFYWDAINQTLHWSDELHRIYGRNPAEFVPSFEAYVAQIHPEDRGRVMQRIGEAMQRGVGFTHDYRILSPAGEVHWVSAIGKVIKNEAGNVVGLAGTCQDITERKLSKEMLSAQAEVLANIAQGAPLSETLHRLLVAVDRQAEDMMSSILILDPTGQRLSHIAGPSLPDSYSTKLRDLPIGPKVGSCGTAAFTKMPVYVKDIQEDLLWEDYRELASPHGLRACWSTPILDVDGKVLGTLAIYSKQPALPSEDHKRIIEAATNTAAICINRAQSEDALRASESTLRRAQSMAQVGSWVYNIRENSLSGSEEFCRLCQWKQAPHSAEELWELVHTEDRERVLAAWNEAIQGNAYEIEHRLMVAGKVRWIHARAHPEFDESGQPVRITGMTQQITDRKRLEIALRALSSAAMIGSGSEFYQHLCNQLGNVFESTSALIAELREGSEVNWNVLGFGGCDHRHFSLIKDQLEFIGAQILKSSIPISCQEIQFRTEKTTDPHHNCLFIPLFDSGCQCIGTMAVFHPPHHPTSDWATILRLFSERASVEIERNRSFNAIQSAEARFRSVIENSHDCLLLIDCDERFSYASPAIERILGYKSEELVGRDMGLFLTSDQLPEFAAHRLRVCQYFGAHETVVIQVQHSDGGLRWLRISETNQLNDPSLRAIVSNWHDITEQKAAESAKARLETQLRQSQKMEAIGTLAGGIAHDFNNILGSITGYAELALLQCDQQEAIRADLKDILRSGFRAKELVRRILTFSRQEEPQRLPLALESVVTDSLRLLRAGVPANIELIAEISPSLPAVLADATQIQQVLLNLVSNAAAAIGPKAGRVVVGLSEVLIDAELTERHPNFLPVKAVRLSVRDNGPGIEPTILDRIFEPFFTTKGPGQGTGLGLSVVHGIVRSHEGIIEVHSESSEGTEFEIYLPACTSPVQANSSNSFPEEAAPLVVPTKLKGTILLVDDEGSLLQVTTKILQHHGFEVIPASSPSEALELFQHSAHLIELIITDYAMPGCNGVDFARQIHGLRRSMPIILCSGHGVGIHRERALELGFREFLTKPISMDKLISVVSRLLSNTVKAD